MMAQPHITVDVFFTERAELAFALAKLIEAVSRCDQAMHVAECAAAIKQARELLARGRVGEAER